MPEEEILEGTGILSPETPPGLSLAEAAARLGKNEPDIRKLIALGRLRAEKIGNRWYIDPSLKISKPTFAQPFQTPQGFSHLTAPRDDPFFALRSLPEDSIIEIYRMRQGRRCYVVSMAPEEFSLRTVATHWGGGAYLAIGIADGQITIEKPFSIDGPEKHPDNPSPKDPPISIPLSTDPQSLQIQQLAGQVQALQQALMALAAGANRPQEDGESRKRWLEELLLMKQAMAPPPPPPQISPEESRKRWLEEMMLIKQMFAQPQQQSDLGAISGALMKGVEMAATVSSIGEKEGVGTALIKGMIPTLSEVVGGIAKNLLTPPPSEISASAPQSSSSEIRQIPVGNSSNGNTDNMRDRPSQSGSGLDLLLPVLRRAARENRDPYPYAAMIASEIPEEAVEHLKAATEEQFQQFAASLDPQLLEYPGWIGELRTALLAELEEDEGRGTV